MEIIKITDLSAQLSISSRTLRYYEQVGLLQSIRPDGEAYRYYDEENVERLRQILVLRKMQIPIKDILHIYESQDMRVVVQVFVDRLHAIDREVTALSELKQVIDAFLQTMVKNGITKISALPLLYEEMGKQLHIREERDSAVPITYERLDDIAGRVNGAREPACDIVELPAMRLITSRRREDGRADEQGFWTWLSGAGVAPGRPGGQSLFECQDETGQTVLLQRVDPSLENDGPFEEEAFAGGLFACMGLYADEDIPAAHRWLIQSFDGSPYYQVDYRADGRLRHETLAESVYSPDEKRERLRLFLAVRKKAPDLSLYEAGRRLQGIPAGEIEAASPVLWTAECPAAQLKPEPEWAWSYRLNERGEGDYSPVIASHFLSTGVKVRLPFRVDAVFQVEMDNAAYGYGADEGDFSFLHGSQAYGVNKGNYPNGAQEAIAFDQPIFGDRHVLPGLGKIRPREYNQLSWIVGDRFFAVLLNGEVRYCAADMPYMETDWRYLPPQEIRVTGNGSSLRRIQWVRVSQLQPAPNLQLAQGALRTAGRPSNNLLPNIRALVHDEYGENYWFNGCAGYVMECLGEPDYDYWFFAGLTGDNFTPFYIYPHNDAFFDSASDCLLHFGNPKDYVERLFAACGYACTFAGSRELRENRDAYRLYLTAYIDRGVPVILYRPGQPHSVCVGYEDWGETLLYVAGNQAEPQRLPLDDAIGREDAEGAAPQNAWIFVGEKQERKPLAAIYRQRIQSLAAQLTRQTDGCFFGAAALRAWADDIDGGQFDGMTPEEFDKWKMYTCYVCCIATNSGGCQSFLRKAMELNPDLAFLEQVSRQYSMTGLLWTSDPYNPLAEEILRQQGALPDSLEAADGGFNVSLAALQDPARRARITAVLQRLAACMDEVVRLLQENLPER